MDRHVPSARPTAPASDSNPTRSNVSSLPCTGEVVAVLAQMALAHAA